MRVIYHEIDDGGEDDGDEPAEVGVSDEGSDQREAKGDTNPGVDILGSRRC